MLPKIKKSGVEFSEGRLLYKIIKGQIIDLFKSEKLCLLIVL